VLGVENLLRKYVKKEKYKPFVESTELDIVDLKGEMNGLIEKMENLEKETKAEVHNSVRKATASLKM